MNNNAINIPNWADEIVAPVVGDTNLFIHNCCIIRPATLIPNPVHNIAKSLGSRDIKNNSIWYISPVISEKISISITPINRDIKDKIIKVTVKIIVE